MSAQKKPLKSAVHDASDAFTTIDRTRARTVDKEKPVISVIAVEKSNETARNEGIGARRRADFGDIRRALKLKSLVHETMDRWYVTHI